eukprot:CAMPEP_0172209610 /NCGR_PEP_ID=MMETSP1050-20130122/35236_1 /TAXON_ID=233186 /ORGANISM="Cryptomonas curvata, Strain CCAP979/52" /LENGTH=451 /DNA_ID=CAMNT_0012889557 /DNA_START=153 /DNA_END=1505 /DNA_ORIENTATION=-
MISSMSIKIPYFNSPMNSEDAKNKTPQHSVCGRLSASADQSNLSACADLTNNPELRQSTALTSEPTSPKHAHSPAEQVAFQLETTSNRACVDASPEEAVSRNGKVIHVLKRDGRLQPLSPIKLQTRLARLMGGLNAEFVSFEIVVVKVVNGAFDGCRSSELDSLAAETAAYLAMEHPDYSLLAARVAVSALHKATVPSFSATMERLFAYAYPGTGEALPRIAGDVMEVVRAHAAVLDAAVVEARDLSLDYFGFKTLEKAYLLRLDGRVVERPQHMLMRVAVGIHKADVASAIRTYDYMSLKYFTHATPTLFNAGTPNAQLSSCFLLQIRDNSVEAIYDTLRQCATISSEAGGIGFSAHKIWARGSSKAAQGGVNGLVPTLRVFNATARLCDQGAGKRPGAFAVYLEPWHAEVFEFLELRKNTGAEECRARDLFYALWIPDLFMQRVKEDGP